MNYQTLRDLHIELSESSYQIIPDTDSNKSAKLLHIVMCLDARDLMNQKNHDYRAGTGDPFANFRMSTNIGIHPILGILIRMLDKTSRIKTFATKGTLKVKEESVRDTLLDVINYSVLIMGMIKDAYPDYVGDQTYKSYFYYPTVNKKETLINNMNQEIYEMAKFINAKNFSELIWNNVLNLIVHSVFFMHTLQEEDKNERRTMQQIS